MILAFVMLRAQAVAVSNALIALTVGASLGDLSSLNELVSFLLCQC